MGLVAIDATTGERLWQRHDLAPAIGVNEQLHLLGGLVPALVELRPRMTRRPPIGLAMIDARTGKDVGPVVQVVETNTRIEPTDDYCMRPGGIVVGTDEALFAFETLPVDWD